MKTQPRTMTGKETHLLLYLNKDTFSGVEGQRLCRQLEQALMWESGKHIHLIHERDPTKGACEFELFFQAVPDSLIESGIFAKLAATWLPGSHRRICVKLSALALGAKTIKKVEQWTTGFRNGQRVAIKRVANTTSTVSRNTADVVQDSISAATRGVSEKATALRNSSGRLNFSDFGSKMTEVVARKLAIGGSDVVPAHAVASPTSATRQTWPSAGAEA